MNKLRSLVFVSLPTLWQGGGTTYRFLFACISVIWLLGFLVGVFAPITILSDNWVLQAYVSAMAFVTNPRGLMGTKSLYPEVSALYHAIAIWSLPLWTLFIWKWMNSQLGPNKTDMIFKVHLSIGNRLTLFLLLPLWIFLAYVGFRANHGGNTRLVAFGPSRMQLAVFGMGFHMAVATCVNLACFSLKRLLSFKKTEDKK
jgi:hypothetical protein